MPSKGYVHVATSLRKEDADKLKTLMEAHGYTTLHKLLKNLISGNTQLTSKSDLINHQDSALNQPTRDECGVRDLNPGYQAWGAGILDH